jgi:hypothetical protein
MARALTWIQEATCFMYLFSFILQPLGPEKIWIRELLTYLEDSDTLGVVGCENKVHTQAENLTQWVWLYCRTIELKNYWNHTGNVNMWWHTPLKKKSQNEYLVPSRSFWNILHNSYHISLIPIHEHYHKCNFCKQVFWLVKFLYIFSYHCFPNFLSSFTHCEPTLSSK